MAGCGQQVNTTTDIVLREWPSQIGGERPAPVFVPLDVANHEKLPMIIMLHGYGVNGELQDLIFGLEDRVEADRFVLVRPEGTKNDSGKRFWNATPVCCDFDSQPIDDVGYISGLVAEAVEKLPVDPQRVSLVGHSNGGYMAYRMMCAKPELFYSMVSLAGSVFLDPADCAHPGPIRLMQIHGTEDATVPYRANVSDVSDGQDAQGNGVDKIRTVGAEAAVARWARRGHCNPQPVTVATVNFLDDIPGRETEKIVYEHCNKDASVTLYRVNGGDHLFLGVNDIFRNTIVDFVLAQ